MPRSPQFTVQIPSRKKEPPRLHEASTAPVPQEIPVAPPPKPAPKITGALTIAVDVSDVSIEMLVVGSEYTTCQYGRKALSPGTIVHGEIKSVGGFREALQSLLHEVVSGATDVRVVMSIPNDQIFTHHVTLPPGTKRKDRDAVVRHKLSDQLLFPIQDVYIDYLLRGEGDTSHAFCAVALKKVVDTYVGIFESIGLHMVLLDIEAAAVGRAVLPLPDNEQAAVVLLDIGSNKTELSMFEHDQLQFSVSLSVGGDHLTHVLAGAKGISEQEAEQLKCSAGLHMKEADSNLIIEALEPIVSEIPKSIEYYRQYSSTQVSHIILVGGSSLLSGLRDYIASRTGLETSIADALTHVSAHSCTDQPALMYATLIGLALRAEHEGEPGINLAQDVGEAKSPGFVKECSSTVLRFLYTPRVGIAIIFVLTLSLIFMAVRIFL